MVAPASSDSSFDGLSRDGDSLLKRIYILAVRLAISAPTDHAQPYIGTGQGHLLLELAKREAIARKSSRLLLSVYPLNVVARAFYERQGFKRIGEYTFRVRRALLPR